MSIESGTLVLLVLWGTLVGLDLVSVPQAMIARPVVAGTIAGWALGDLEAGVRVGMLLELFALDVLPVGASRYPDYGPGTVGAVAYAALVPGWINALGVSAAIGLALGLVGGRSMQWQRHRVADDVHRQADRIAAGDRVAIRRVMFRSIARDAFRSAALTAGAVGLAVGLARWLVLAPRSAQTLTLVAVGCGLAAVIGGALRSAGRGARMRWLVAGAAGTILLAALR